MRLFNRCTLLFLFSLIYTTSLAPSAFSFFDELDQDTTTHIRGLVRGCVSSPPRTAFVGDPSLPTQIGHQGAQVRSSFSRAISHVLGVTQRIRSTFNSSSSSFGPFRGTPQTVAVYFSMPRLFRRSSTSEEGEVKQDALEELQSKIHRVESELSGHPFSNRVTILLGKSEAGKTVIYNYLQGVELVAVDSEEGIVIERKNNKNEKKGKIGPGARSETTLPSLSTNGDILDSPGFGDMRGELQDIVNAYSISLGLKEANQVRLVLVASVHELFSTRAGLLLKFCNKLNNCFLERKRR